MHRVLILADDLSGAADCGVACVRAGLSAVVSLSDAPEDIEADILALDADTRGMSSAAAAQRIYDLTCRYASGSSVLLFKKIDSTLRGHLGPELVAMLRARRETVPDAVAILAPAFPSAGRTTDQGIQYLHGGPLHESEMWRREQMSGQAHIPSMLTDSGLRCMPVDLEALHDERGAFLEKIRSASGSTDVVVVDAMTTADLAQIAAGAASLGERALWVGSAGLAQHLVEACGLRPAAVSLSQNYPASRGPSLFVIGSTSSTTKQQVAALLAGSGVHDIVISPETLLAGSGSAQWNALAAQLSEAMDRGQDVMLRCGSEPEVTPMLRASLAQALGEMAAVVCGRAGALVASGGETARKVLERWGVRSMQLHSELENGVPVSSAAVDASWTVRVITKAGDFGQPTTLLHCHQWLKQKRME